MTNAELIDSLHERVEKLMDVKEHYFPVDRGAKQELLLRLIHAIEQHSTRLVERQQQLTTGERARLAFEYGRALDALESFSPIAQEQLSLAVKLDPDNLSAWNALAHCFWKKRDLTAAKSCYVDTLRRDTRNVVALRALSQLLRQSPKAAQSDLRESVDRAKTAVAADLRDAASWSILGNAHLSLYFAGGRDATELQRANKAFAKAASLESGGSDPRIVFVAGDDISTEDIGSAAAADAADAPQAVVLRTLNPDLHYNRAQALVYQEDFPEALAAYRLAKSIDPCLPCDVAMEALYRNAQRVAAAVSTGARLHAKKQKELVDSLQLAASTATAAAAAPAFSSNSSSLKSKSKSPPPPAATDTTTESPHLPAAAPEFRIVGGAHELVEGPNCDVHVFLKPLFVVPKDNSPPATVLCLDATGSVVPVCFYHFDEGVAARLNDKDTLRLINPVLKTVWIPAEGSPDATTAQNTNEATAAIASSATTTAPASAAAASVEAASATRAGTIGSFRAIHVESAEGVAVIGRHAGQKIQAGLAQLSIATFDQ